MLLPIGSIPDPMYIDGQFANIIVLADAMNPHAEIPVSQCELLLPAYPAPNGSDPHEGTAE